MSDKEKPENPFAYPLTDGQSFATNGMTMLDHFAGLAMQAEISRQLPDSRIYFETLVDSAYSYAEAMLIERQKRLNP